MLSRRQIRLQGVWTSNVRHLHQALVLANVDKLDPKDVIVLAPDIEAYAPCVEAVFEAGQDGRPRIPFTVADRSGSSWNDGIPDWWRLLYFGTVSNLLSAADLDFGNLLKATLTQSLK